MRLTHLAFWRQALRVLCYHRVLPNHSDRFTVTTDQLDTHLSYLNRSGFTFVRVRDLLSGDPLPRRPLLITFDDGYADNLDHAQPVLRRHGGKATIFIVSAYAGDCARWDKSAAPLMGPDQLRNLDPNIFELGLHSHSHRAFGALSLDEIADDVQKNLDFFRDNDIAAVPALAYPYGSRPRRTMPELSHRLAKIGISLAFRVGNRINRLPLRNPYEIQRIDVSGLASDLVFRRKLWFGKFL
jgi:peptidoglycan/xylan/chitin deacetylase (PgdA/CDA1 family)